MGRSVLCDTRIRLQPPAYLPGQPPRTSHEPRTLSRMDPMPQVLRRAVITIARNLGAWALVTSVIEIALPVAAWLAAWVIPPIARGITSPSRREWGRHAIG